MGGAANAVNMSLFAKPPYDTRRDLAPVVWCVQGANVLSVHPSLPAVNLKQLIALAKARPGELNFASSGIGGSNHMAGELLKVMARINIVHVPYKGQAPALTDLLGGQVSMMFGNWPEFRGHVQSGKLVALGMATARRSVYAPQVPTLAELGYRAANLSSQFGVFAPAALPPALVARYNAEINKALQSADLKKKLPEAYWIAEPVDVLERNARLVAEAGDAPLKIAAHAYPDRGATLVTVYAADHPGLFYRIAGAIHLAGGNIIDARIHTTRTGMALDNFLIQDPLGRPFDGARQLQRLEQGIEDALANRGRLADRLAARPLPRTRAEGA